MYVVKWRDPNADLSSFHVREQRNNISVTSLSEEERTIPNPVKTFEQAFSHYRKTVCVCKVWKIELCAYTILTQHYAPPPFLPIRFSYKYGGSL